MIFNCENGRYSRKERVLTLNEFVPKYGHQEELLLGDCDDSYASFEDLVKELVNARVDES